MQEDAMVRSKRTLRVEAISALVQKRIAHVAKVRDWELLEEIARIGMEDAPLDLAATDPALFIALRNAITSFHLAGWTNMTPERVRAVCSGRTPAHAGDA
jgi:hypothetical protein